MLNLSLREIAIIIPVILVSLTVHELAHAAAALALGDDTAKLDGRVTLNPLRHVDPFGFLMIVVAGFGWAKPVRFDRTKLRRPERDEVLIAFAGPFSNLLLAVIGVLAIRIVVWNRGLAASTSATLVLDVLFAFCSINVALAVFNSLPIPPLDGSHAITTIIGRRNPAAAAAFAKYGLMLLIGAILVDRVAGINLLPIARLTRAILTAMLSAVGV